MSKCKADERGRDEVQLDWDHALVVGVLQEEGRPEEQDHDADAGERITALEPDDESRNCAVDPRRLARRRRQTRRQRLLDPRRDSRCRSHCRFRRGSRSRRDCWLSGRCWRDHRLRRCALFGSGRLEVGEALLQVAELCIERFKARAQVHDLRDQSTDRGADEKAADALLDRGHDHAEQEGQAPSRPLRGGSFFCLHARTRCGARILVPLPLAQQCERHLLHSRRRQRPARHQALDRPLAPGPRTRPD